MIEEWKQIPSKPKYEASNLGRIRNRRSGYVLKEHENNKGYYRVGLSMSQGTRHYLVHRLVAEAWIPVEGFKDLQINHKDRNTANNSVDNLEWCNYRQNKEHHENTPIYSNTTPIFKSFKTLNMLQVLEIIKKYYREQVSFSRIMSEYGKSRNTIKAVIQFTYLSDTEIYEYLSTLDREDRIDYKNEIITLCTIRGIYVK